MGSQLVYATLWDKLVYDYVGLKMSELAFVDLCWSQLVYMLAMLVCKVCEN